MKRSADRTMETKCAPNYVIVFMVKLIHVQVTTSKALDILDEISMIWPYTLQELSSYLVALISFHKTIKFTTEGSHTEVNFLNVTVYKDNQRHIHTALYTQPKDSHLINTFITVCFSLNLRNKVYQRARP